jgi:hypothetical protein
MPKSQREAAVLYAETRLEPWGKWSRGNSEGLGLPRVSIIHKIMRRKLIRGLSKNKQRLSAKGKETLSFRPRTVGSMPDAVSEVDLAVAALSPNLQIILKIEYIHLRNAPAEDRCAAAGIGRRRYGQLLECAKYSIYAALNT